MSLGVEKKKMFRVFIFFFVKKKTRDRFENAETRFTNATQDKESPSLFLCCFLLYLLLCDESGGKTLAFFLALFYLRELVVVVGFIARARVVLNILQRHGNERERERERFSLFG